jgi:hypothetical protein
VPYTWRKGKISYFCAPDQSFFCSLIAQVMPEQIPGVRLNITKNLNLDTTGLMSRLTNILTKKSNYELQHLFCSL